MRSEPSSSPWVYTDNVHLLYGGDFQGSTIGMATVGSMCGSRSGGVNQVYFEINRLKFSFKTSYGLVKSVKVRKIGGLQWYPDDFYFLQTIIVQFSAVLCLNILCILTHSVNEKTL